MTNLHERHFWPHTVHSGARHHGTVLVTLGFCSVCFREVSQAGFVLGLGQN